jgi:hypothetical protein
MTLNELTNEDAIEAVREETWEEASEANMKQVFALIDKGLSGEQLKQALLRDRLRVVPQTTRTKSSKL